ncbi:MAG: TetR family transcriptional regulator [Dehalococcoidia bacterium]|nr:MAG: TetR family transcriptional regulator [Dehalococcoidia bacterium]
MSSSSHPQVLAEESRDPRVVRSRAAILRAAADLLIESGASAVTIGGISERSGVAKTTIYRQWKSRSQLVFDAFESLLAPATHISESGPIRQQLEALLIPLVRGLTSSEWALAVPALVDASERDPEMRQLLRGFLAGRKENGRSTLRAAMARGELRPDLVVDEAVTMLIGPIYYRRLVSGETLDERFVAEIVDQFLRGAARTS